MKPDGIKAHLIYNPTAGPRDARRSLDRIRSHLEHRGWSVELRMTEKSGDAIDLARAAAQAGCDVAIVAGGDGTIGEAINGLVHTQTALGVLPMGTANVLARQLGISTHTMSNPLRLQETINGWVEGTIRPVDVGQLAGQANDRYFMCWAGVGLDAQVTARMESGPRHTRRLRMLPYVIAILMVARDFQGVKTCVTLDGNVIRGRTVLTLISNIQQYGAVFNVAPDARIDDGLLDVFVFKGLGSSYAIRHLVKMLIQRHMHDPQVVYRRARHIEIQTEGVVPVQVDGDPIATTPVTVRVVPHALRLLVPPSAPSSLFTCTM
ncbi:MAG: diacylglycerol kinase family lipid kinase [Chloroflexi bacterium]|nr:diacylglycerol kinase family lipid kinase [Chloroflexota bacterium]